ncbi:MAG: hypothetical protein AAF611_00300 [Bacteroidota bacterium]
MAHKLSLIKEQTAPLSGWNTYENNPYDNQKIPEITDNIGNSEIPVTSIPSPFAQMHLFDTAFDFVNKSYNISKSQEELSGKTTFHRYISQCLDIYEILFSYHTLEAKDDIDIETWDISELNELSKDPNTGVRTFAETLKIYISNYNNDKKFKNNGIKNPFNSFTLIYYKNKVIAATSPHTGFFTIGDALPTTIKSNFNNRSFFTTFEPLFKRSNEFQEFMNIFYRMHGVITSTCKAVSEYIKINRNHIQDQELQSSIGALARNFTEDHEKKYSILEIDNKEVALLGGVVPFLCKTYDKQDTIGEVRRSDYVIITNKTLENNPLALRDDLNKPRWTYINSAFPKDATLDYTKPIDKRTLPGTIIEYPWFGRNDFLSPHLIQLGYEVNTTKFWMPKGEINNIILPITPAYFKYFTIADLKKQLTIERLNSGAIVVSLDIPVMADNKRGIIVFERTYNEVAPSTIDNDDYGAIIDSSLGFGMYPFFKVADKKFNDRFKILSYYKNIEKVGYEFFREHTSSNKSIEIDASLHSRTREEENYNCITDYVELTTFTRNPNGDIEINAQKDITFDFISVTINNKIENTALEGILILIFGEPIMLSSEKASIAFDIGTSNSYVALKSGNSIESLASYIENSASIQPNLVMLNAIGKNTKTQKDSYDLDQVDPIYDVVQLAEFLPSMIGDKSEYSFPIRSIINIDNDTQSEKLEELNVLSNVNIPFAFGQRILRDTFDYTFSNIKWGVTDSNNDFARNRLHVFIEQLVWMGRNQLLKLQKSPDKTDVLWFKPLSMGANQMTVFTEIWNEVYKTYFAKTDNYEKLMQITESWAPKGSYDQTFGLGKVFMNIDIGGGTSDVIIFDDDVPKMTTSFRFAGNSLFESVSGNNRFDNGFVTRYEDVMKKSFGDDFSKTDIIEYIKSSDGLNSTDLISYFFNYNTFSKKLKLDSDFKLLFLLHNAAIFYHSTQVLKMTNLNKLPSYIGVSGNGARLLEITNGSEDLNRINGMARLASTILTKVFNLDKPHKLELQVISNPKEATAKGGIRGLQEFKKFEGADEENYCISLGDNEQFFNVNANNSKANMKYADYLKDGDTTIEKVADNVIAFFEYFFGDLWDEINFVRNFALDKSYNAEKLKDYFASKDRIRDVIRQEVNKRKDTDPKLSETMFFYAIKAYIYGFSKIIVSDKLNEFKGGS